MTNPRVVVNGEDIAIGFLKFVSDPVAGAYPGEVAILRPIIAACLERLFGYHAETIATALYADGSAFYDLHSAMTAYPDLRNHDEEVSRDALISLRNDLQLLGLSETDAIDFTQGFLE